MMEDKDDSLLEAIADIALLLNDEEERKSLVGSPPTKVLMFVEGLPIALSIDLFKKRFGLDETG
jgi:hypothetical protein